MKPSEQRLVDPGAIAVSEDCEAGIFLTSPQQIIDFSFGVAVVVIFHVCAFVKRACASSKDRTAQLRSRIKDPA